MLVAYFSVGVTEKGYVDVEVELNLGSRAGHSSVPKPGLGVLSKLGAVAHKAEQRQMTMYLNDATVEMCQVVSREFGFLGKFILRNIRFFWPIARPILNRTIIASLFRTTSTVTMFNGGIKHNVLPSQGRLIINHRIHPEDNISKVLERDKSLMLDEHMTVTALRPAEPHPVAPFDETAVGYHSVKVAIEQTFGPDKVLVVPGLFVAASDSRHYLRLTDACYRFLPTCITLADAGRYHGPDEKISLENYEQTINFYINLIRNADSKSVTELYH